MYSLYKAGEQWNLSSGEITLLDEFMKGYEFNSIDREMIKNVFIPGVDDQESSALSLVEIMKELQEYYSAAKMNVIKIGKELKALGFKQRVVRRGLTMFRVYDCIKLNKAEKLKVDFVKRI